MYSIFWLLWLCTHLFCTAESGSLWDYIFPLLSSFPNSFLICYCIIFSCVNIWPDLPTSEMSSAKYLSVQDFTKFQPATESTSSIFPRGIFWSPPLSVQSGSGLVYACHTRCCSGTLPHLCPGNCFHFFSVLGCLFLGSHLFFSRFTWSLCWNIFSRRYLRKSSWK